MVVEGQGSNWFVCAPKTNYFIERCLATLLRGFRGHLVYSSQSGGNTKCASGRAKAYRREKYVLWWIFILNGSSDSVTLLTVKRPLFSWLYRMHITPTIWSAVFYVTSLLYSWMPTEPVPSLSRWSPVPPSSCSNDRGSPSTSTQRYLNAHCVLKANSVTYSSKQNLTSTRWLDMYKCN